MEHHHFQSGVMVSQHSTIRFVVLFHVCVHIGCAPFPAINLAAWHCHGSEVTWPSHSGPTLDLTEVQMFHSKNQRPTLDLTTLVSCQLTKECLPPRKGQQVAWFYDLVFALCQTDKQIDLVEATCSYWLLIWSFGGLSWISHSKYITVTQGFVACASPEPGTCWRHLDSELKY